MNAKFGAFILGAGLLMLILSAWKDGTLTTDASENIHTYRYEITSTSKTYHTDEYSYEDEAVRFTDELGRSVILYGNIDIVER